jgi:hypothetical protein
MADMKVQKNSVFQRFSHQISGKNVKYFEKCAVLENHLISMQEELKLTKLLINFLSKNIGLKVK